MDLTPCIVQDARTGEVLTLAYMNDEALARTRETGEMRFWSRSRGELWHKGETSGNVQRVRALRYDCDDDALLALVEPAGPACHTGERTCFHRGEMDPSPGRGPSRRSSARSPSAGRPTRRRATPPRCSPIRPGSARRCEEEAEEVARAAAVRDATSGWPRRPPTCSTTWPSCSRARGLSMADAYEVLNERRR